ncbi:uncharacterized protein F5891DRAFT_1191849 [Suillus fuscotomentosus]|uniref:Uncharacterized protein n=1 Tax=Suillus fuscotomentosus TaxID=1912939 RepID=A0AAD4E0B9_9AGAM|nr:uncharacterized protein F5891DRAFT_1191849 [Suillus fuscotomentosus]KAG1897413.1 hypothetical protein F5891DRAFT_1191849 [Suillus fuscotomentosus]
MLQEHEKLNLQPNELGCNLETVIGAIMLWSDSTHLASFGNASLWPIYLFIGNQSKYIHGKPTSFAAHHLAYIPKNFFLCLKDHLLGCLSGLAYDGDETSFTAAEWNSVIIINNWIYCYKVLHVNYTTYDLQHAQDSLNPRTHADIIVLAHNQEDSHPYWIPFQREKEHHRSEFNEGFEEDENMDKEGDNGSGDDSEEETDSMDDEDGDEVPAPFEAMVDDTVADKMDEYEYSGVKS